MACQSFLSGRHLSDIRVPLVAPPMHARDSNSMKISKRLGPDKVVNINDLRRLAQKRLPKVVFDFLDGGAEDELTLSANEAAFRQVSFRPRHAVAFPHCDLRTRVLSSELSFPVMLAPVGCTRVMHPHGEVGIAKVAGAAGTVYILPTASGHLLEDVKAAASGPLWYQLYLVGGREAAEAVLARAWSSGFSALVVTIDTPVAGMRESTLR